MNLESKLTTFDCRLLTLDYIAISRVSQSPEPGEGETTWQTQETQQTQQLKQLNKPNKLNKL
jgi:hypothetical protein